MTGGALKSVNCTSCGAGLDVLGGGRVIVHVCPYCGAELDAQHDYAVLAQATKRPRPDTPFTLGMTGRLMDVDWTVIGTIGMTESTWRWVEHQLYSPTHGYAWLTVENGHLTFARRMRKPSTPAFISSATVEAAEHRPSVLLDGERYAYYETSTPQISYLEGEFTWAPRMGDRTTVVSMLSESALLDYSTTGQEREVYRSVWLSPAEVNRAFGVNLPEPHEVHPLQPFDGGAHDGFLMKASGAFAAAALVAAIVTAGATTSTILPRMTIGRTELPQTVSFDVTDTEHLVRIDLQANPDNAWLFVGFELADPEGETLFASGRSMEFYSGTDSEGSWTEGNRSASLLFRPAVPGTYEATFDEIETELWSMGTEPQGFSVSATEGVRKPLWLVLLAAGFGLIAAAPFGLRFLHRKRRLAGSDWSDED